MLLIPAGMYSARTFPIVLIASRNHLAPSIEVIDNMPSEHGLNKFINPNIPHPGLLHPPEPSKCQSTG